MERRRFFPSKRVQQEPGRTVELALELKPNAPLVQASGCKCDVDGVAWYGDWYTWEGSEKDHSAGGPGYAFGVSQGMKPVGSSTRLQGGRLVGTYVDIPDEIPMLLRAVVLGRTLCDVQWAWTLDTPELPNADTWWEGLDITELNGSLMVNVGYGRSAGVDVAPAWWAELRASATCAGQRVGTLVLRPGFNLWNADPALPDIEIS